MSTPPTVFVVDDDAAVLRAIRRLLKSVDLNAETFSSGETFLEAYDETRPGCVIVDVRMPGLSGLDVQRKLNQLGVKTPIIFITGHGDVPMCARAMKSGAMDFVQKPFNDQTLLDIIQDAIQRDDQARRKQAEESELRERLQILTPRESQVLGLVVSGLTNKQVADRLGTSEKTIKVHRAHVMQKMQADSLADLVLMAQAAGLCSPKVQWA